MERAIFSEADLHIHSNASDGQLNHEEIVMRASELGLAVIAVIGVGVVGVGAVGDEGVAGFVDIVKVN